MKVPPELVNKIMAQKSLIYFVLKWERAFKSQSHLLFLQVCDLQAKVKRLNTENQDLTSQLRVYKETQVTFRSKLARSFYLVGFSHLKIRANILKSLCCFYLLRHSLFTLFNRLFKRWQKYAEVVWWHFKIDIFGLASWIVVPIGLNIRL